MKKLLLLVMLFATFSAQSKDFDNIFYGVFTTEDIIGDCKIANSKPVRIVAWLGDIKKPKDVALFIEKESGRLQYNAMKAGSNAIIGYQEEVILSKSWGVVGTFTGVGVSLLCTH